MKRTTFLNILFVLIFLIAGRAGFSLLASLKEPVDRQDEQHAQAILRTVRAKATDHRVQLTLFGHANALETMEIKSEVSGRIETLHPQFHAGGFIPEGELIFQIDSRDYKIAVQKKEAALERSLAVLEQRKIELSNLRDGFAAENKSLELAREELKRYQSMLDQKTVSINDVEQRESTVAQQESNLLNSQSRLQTLPALIRQAKADVQSARSDLKLAQTRLKRTSLKAPYDARIGTRTVATGEFINAGQKLGTLMNLEVMEIAVPVAASEIRWLFKSDTMAQGMPESSPGLPNQNMAVRTRVTPLTPQTGKSFPARLARTASSLDSKTRSLMLYFEIQNLAGGVSEAGLLLPGTFLRMDLQARTLKSVFVLPRLSVRDGKVQIVRDNQILWLPIEVQRDTGSTLLVHGDFQPGDEIVQAAQPILTNNTPVQTVLEDFEHE